ncbi:glycerophosphodiester phosphodiesterase family protein [Dyadobacter arcticus]|uniref:Glycerophosphoryl diester phosphodiesterase n=1 Tax=Dyadobacter arcticus TaxID=1078754 RepID=A0ABX0UPA3_9BACT|nr:glycerophosphodiester phosphodiesterase family protein [Dyadobacter arcticus]NIJ54687.1 glycerophosphoryl diester phosphodiesterase [Dyadobacter arcticus]
MNSVNAQVSIVAHRGGLYFQYPESSMTLFNSTASSFAADTVVIEIDIRKSKDGTLYLMHDPSIDRTTNGEGQLADLGDGYLNSLRLKTKDGTITSDHIPTFNEVLTFIGNRNINLMLDIKAPVHKEVLEQVKKHKLENRMLVLTFQNEVTAQVAKISQNVLLSALIETDEAWKSFEQIPVHNGRRIAYVTTKTPAKLITALLQKNVLIMADVSEDIRSGGKPLHADAYRSKVNAQKLDILISDFPIEARDALRPEK